MQASYLQSLYNYTLDQLGSSDQREKEEKIQQLRKGISHLLGPSVTEKFFKLALQKKSMSDNTAIMLAAEVDCFINSVKNKEAQ